MPKILTLKKKIAANEDQVFLCEAYFSRRLFDEFFSFEYMIKAIGYRPTKGRNKKRNIPTPTF